MSNGEGSQSVQVAALASGPPVAVAEAQDSSVSVPSVPSEVPRGKDTRKHAVQYSHFYPPPPMTTKCECTFVLLLKTLAGDLTLAAAGLSIRRHLIVHQDRPADNRRKGSSQRGQSDMGSEEEESWLGRRWR